MTVNMTAARESAAREIARERKERANALVCMPCATYLQTGWLPAPDDVLDLVEDWRATLTGYYAIAWDTMQCAPADGFTHACHACGDTHPVMLTIDNAYPIATDGKMVRMDCDVNDDFTIEFDRDAANTAIPNALGWLQHKGHADYVARLQSLKRGKRFKAMNALVAAGAATMTEPTEPIETPA